MDIIVKCSIVQSFTLFIVLCISSVAALAQQDTQDSEPLWIDQAIDDVISPVKKWLDNDPDHSDTQEQASHAHSIRSAIKQALKQHEGVVLSADKFSNHYDIKILSHSGKIKVIRIEHKLSTKKGAAK